MRPPDARRRPFRRVRPGRSSSASQASSTARRSRSRAAIAGAFVTAIAAPIAGSPRATRVESRQPPAPPRRRPAARRSRPIGSPGRRSGDGLDERRRDDQRQVADPGDRAVVGRRVHPDDPRPARPGELATRVDVRAPARAPGTTTHGRSTNRSASDASYPAVSRPAIGWPPTKRRPAASARATSIALVLATSVTTASAGRRDRHGPASSSINVRQAVAGAARTTRSASSQDVLRRVRGDVHDALGGRPARPVARRRPGGHRPVGGRRVRADARAIEPAIRPKPMNPTCMVASIAAAGWGRSSDRSANRPSRRRRVASAGARRCPVRRVARPPPSTTGSPRPRVGPPFAVIRGRARIVRRVLGPMLLPPFRLATIVPEPRAAARAAPLLGEQRCQRRHRVDLAPARPARQSGHGGPARVRPAAARPARPRPSRAGTRSPRASRRGSARRRTGRNGRGRTG